jgi:hypothetical protein
VQRNCGAGISVPWVVVTVRDFSTLFLFKFGKWLWIILGGLIMIKITGELLA